MSRCPHHNCKRHHCFVSYRRRSEETLVRQLVPHLQTFQSPKSHTNLKTFWDQTCIPFGEPFVDRIVAGIQASDCRILVFSEEALQGIETADQHEDNLLLEMEMAVELGENLIPIYVHRGNAPAFANIHLQQFPQAFHAHAASPRNKTIREVIAAILRVNAIIITPTDLLTQLPRIKEAVLSVLAKANYTGDLVAGGVKGGVLAANHAGYTALTHSLSLTKYFASNGYVLNSASFGVGMAGQALVDGIDIYQQYDNYGDVNVARYVTAYLGMGVGAVGVVTFLGPVLVGTGTVGIIAAGTSSAFYYAGKYLV